VRKLLSDRKKKWFHSYQQKISWPELNLNRATMFFGKSRNVLGIVSAGSGYRTIERHTKVGKHYPMLDRVIISIDRRWSVSNKVSFSSSRQNRQNNIFLQDNIA
jgi:hypothetical protein